MKLLTPVDAQPTSCCYSLLTTLTVMTNIDSSSDSGRAGRARTTNLHLLRIVFPKEDKASRKRTGMGSEQGQFQESSQKLLSASEIFREVAKLFLVSPYSPPLITMFFEASLGSILLDREQRAPQPRPSRRCHLRYCLSPVSSSLVFNGQCRQHRCLCSHLPRYLSLYLFWWAPSPYPPPCYTLFIQTHLPLHLFRLLGTS